jgi:hypothetical protein
MVLRRAEARSCFVCCFESLRLPLQPTRALSATPEKFAFHIHFSILHPEYSIHTHPQLQETRALTAAQHVFIYQGHSPLD